MIKKIKSINNFAVFQNYKWDDVARDEGNNIMEFKKFNIIYGRNYSGKTTLSRIFQSIENSQIPENYEQANFSLVDDNGAIISESTLSQRLPLVRVFNEDFIKEHLKFFHDSQEDILPFAVLGKENQQIENEIKLLQTQLGCSDNGSETGLYFNSKESRIKYDEQKNNYEQKLAKIDNLLKTEATSGNNSIRNQPDLYGDQNYNKHKLENDIENSINAVTISLNEGEKEKLKKVAQEQTLERVFELPVPDLKYEHLTSQAKDLLSRKLVSTDKIQDLVNDSFLQQWVKEGIDHHKGKRHKCAFCDNEISDERWKILFSHFDEESKHLEKSLSELKRELDNTINNMPIKLSINTSQFYSKFHEDLLRLQDKIKICSNNYKDSIVEITKQVENKLFNLYEERTFTMPSDFTDEINKLYDTYNGIVA